MGVEGTAAWLYKHQRKTELGTSREASRTEAAEGRNGSEIRGIGSLVRLGVGADPWANLGKWKRALASKITQGAGHGGALL